MNTPEISSNYSTLEATYGSKILHPYSMSSQFGRSINCVFSEYQNSKGQVIGTSNVCSEVPPVNGQAINPELIDASINNS